MPQYKKPLQRFFDQKAKRIAPRGLRVFAQWIAVSLLMACGVASAGTTKTVDVPVQLDYPLLEQLLIAQLFQGPDKSLSLLQDPSGCSKISLSTPSLSGNDSELEVLSTVDARIGMGSSGNCTTLLGMQGGLGISGVPEIRDDGASLGFRPTRVWLLNSAGQVIQNDSLQNLAEANVRAAFEGFSVDLKPQLQSVQDFLPSILPRHSRDQVDALIETLRLSSINVKPETLDATISFRVETLDEPLSPERALSASELVRWEERWQLMDSLLVLTVKHYAAETHLQSLREGLLDVLIESRYRLRDALVEIPETEAEGDVVREWFLQSWQSMAPLIRRIGAEQPGQEHLLFIGVIAATDALDALDELGPSVGLDVSADGLRRLARMINGDTGDALLEYSEDVDPELRKLLEESLNSQPPPSGWRIDLSLFPSAVAMDAGRLNSWAPRTKDLPEYLPMVARLLESSAREISQKKGLDENYQALFRRLVLTTAWQESCWRHYVVSEDRKLVPLRSGSGDVGLMQINERVWRGFYDQQRLRWDIEYNGKAGAEVLIDYLMRYALRKGEHRQPGGVTNLVRASYSAYNGGPSKVARYRSTDASKYGKKVDRLFWEKYQQVAAGNELAVSACLGGNLSGPALAGG
ncbi:MAG: hypothetical protein Cons2KO_04950 [Congregibacter sp.]